MLATVLAGAGRARHQRRDRSDPSDPKRGHLPVLGRTRIGQSSPGRGGGAQRRRGRCLPRCWQGQAALAISGATGPTPPTPSGATSPFRGGSGDQFLPGTGRWRAVKERLMRARFAPFILMLSASQLATEAPAQTIDHATAVRRVTSFQQAAEDLYNKLPRLREIDLVVRQDCAAKNGGQTVDSSFCRCASAVTMGMWRGGIDPSMVPRLEVFLSDPNASANAFTAYEGPELYGPLCEIAER